MTKYECDKCGACCQGHLIVEAYELDVHREPRLIEADPQFAKQSIDDALLHFEDDMRCIILACGTSRPCKFLSSDKTCTIYPTRPNACVGMLAGDGQCQQARQSAGLPPLEPMPPDPAPSELDSCPVISEQERLQLANAELQAMYHQEYLRQIRQRACPGCGDTDIF